MTMQQILAISVLVGLALWFLWALGGSAWNPRGPIERILWGALTAVVVVLLVVVPTGALVGLVWLVKVAAGY